MRYCQCGSEIKNTDIEQRIKHIFGSEYTEQLPSNMISPNYELQQFIKYNTLCSNCIDMKDLKAYLTGCSYQWDGNTHRNFHENKKKALCRHLEPFYKIA